MGSLESAPRVSTSRAATPPSANSAPQYQIPASVPPSSTDQKTIRKTASPPARSARRSSGSVARSIAGRDRGRPRAPAGASETVTASAAFAEAQDLRDGHREDPEVESERPVEDVVVIPLDAVGNRGLAPQAVDLRPAGDPRPDPMAILVADDLEREPRDVLGAFGTRPDEAHVAAEHVEQLGKLIE